MSSTYQSIQTLETFADPAQNPDLLRLENMLKRFNLFEAIGVIRQELRHSNLLACLLDPNQSHGLGTLFLDEMLQSVFSTLGEQYEVFQIDPSDLDFTMATVQREWHYIDILILDEANSIAVIIENKVDSGERSGQLQRYYELVGDKYPGHEIVALYLTRDGDSPTFDRYIPVSYSLVCRAVEKIVEEHRTGLGSDIVMLLEHYALMLRRHIMSDSGVAELCRSIYQQHKQALDLIFEHRPDTQTLIKEYVQQLIDTEVGTIKPCFSQKSYIQFNPIAWDVSPLYQNRYPMCPWLLYFQFSNNSDNLMIVLLMTPGDPLDRATLFDLAKDSGFQGCPNRLANGWSRLFEKSILQAKDYDKSQEEIEEIISQKWADFLRDDLPQITEAIGQEKWLWEARPNQTPSSNSSLALDHRAHIGQYIKTLVENNPELKFYNYDDKKWRWLNFTLQDWDARLKYRYFETNHALFPYLTFNNLVDGLKVGMWVGPGSQVERQRVLQMAIDHSLLGVVKKIGQGDWIKITAYTLLGRDDYEKPLEEIEVILSEKWAEYLRDELPRIVEAVREEKWLWELPS